jgi:hypothetical protein
MIINGGWGSFAGNSVIGTEFTQRPRRSLVTPTIRGARDKIIKSVKHAG